MSGTIDESSSSPEAIVGTSEDLVCATMRSVKAMGYSYACVGRAHTSS